MTRQFTVPIFETNGIGASFYAKDSNNNWHYVNHANTWQTCPPPNNFNTKYKIGDMFWVPRVYEHYVQDKIIVNNKEYVNNSYNLSPTAKIKVVQKIEILIKENNQMEVVYRCSDDYFNHSTSHYNEKKLVSFNNEKDALQFAHDWAADNKTCYYGEKNT